MSQALFATVSSPVRTPLAANRKPEGGKKGTQVKVWLMDDSLKQLEDLAGRTRLPKTQLCTVLLAAALECVSGAGALQLPLRFEIVPEARRDH